MKQWHPIILSAFCALLARAEVISYTMGIDVNCPYGLGE